MIAERVLLTVALVLVGRWLWVNDVMAPWSLRASTSDVYGATVLFGLFGFYGNLALILLGTLLLWLIWAGDRE